MNVHTLKETLFSDFALQQIELPLVSVLMPAYNHQQFVEQAVRSVWAQTYKNIELIVIDDGSSDRTLEILKRLSLQSPISMKVDTHANQGICRTLNKCFDLSRGELIAFLASDDQYSEKFIERMVGESRLHSAEATVLHCDAIGIDEYGKGCTRVSEVRKIPPLRGDVFFKIAYGIGFIVSSTMVLSRTLMKATGPFDALLKSEDFDIHLRLARQARFVYVDEPLFFARKVSGSLGSRRGLWSDDIFIALAKHEDYLGNSYKKIVVSRHKNLAMDFYSNMDLAEAWYHFKKAVKSSPGLASLIIPLQLIVGCFCRTPRCLALAILPKRGVQYARRWKRISISYLKTNKEKFLMVLRAYIRALPKPVRKTLGYCWDYNMRVFRWRSILVHVRGRSLHDQFVLFASAIASPLTSLQKLGRWQDPVLLWDAIVQVKVIGNFMLRHHTDDLWHVLPSREHTVLTTIQKYLPEDGIFIDAGANIGVYTLLAGRLVGEKGRVIAVEMMPETADILRRHISMNHLGNVSVVQKALADSSGKHVIARVMGGQHGQASITSGVVEGGAEVRVETTTIADILAEVDDISLMKMDLEGAEELALVGAGDALKRVRAVIFEDWGNERLSAIFRSKGFLVERLDGNNCLALNESK